MSTLARRIEKIEAVANPVDCPVCSRWGYREDGSQIISEVYTAERIDPRANPPTVEETSPPDVRCRLCGKPSMGALGIVEIVIDGSEEARLWRENEDKPLEEQKSILLAHVAEQRQRENEQNQIRKAA